MPSGVRGPNNGSYYVGGYTAFPSENQDGVSSNSIAQTSSERPYQQPSQGLPRLPAGHGLQGQASIVLGLRRTPSGRGLHGRNVAALGDPLASIARANPLPAIAIDYAYTYNPGTGRNNGLGTIPLSIGQEAMAAHANDIRAQYYSTRRKKDGSAVTAATSTDIVNAQALDANINIAIGKDTVFDRNEGAG